MFEDVKFVMKTLQINSLMSERVKAVRLCHQLWCPLFSGAVHEESEEADEEDEEHDSERHGDHAGVLLLVADAGPPACGLQCGPRILPNLLRHLYGRQPGGGGQDHKGYCAYFIKNKTVCSDIQKQTKVQVSSWFSDEKSLECSGSSNHVWWMCSLVRTLNFKKKNPRHSSSEKGMKPV